MDTALLVLILVFGLAETFFGYRIFRILVVIAGALLGASYGPALLQGAVEGTVSRGAVLVAALVGAVVAGLLAWFAFRLVVALYGLGVGWSLGVAAFDLVLVAVLVAIAAAVVAFVLTRPAIVVLTALNGAWLTVGTVLAMLGRLSAPPPVFFVQPPELPVGRPLWLALVVGLAAVGAIVQLSQGEATLGGRARRPRRRYR